LTTDLVADGLLFCRLLFRSRTALTAEVLFLRKQLAFYERQVQPRRLNDSARSLLSSGLAYTIGKRPWSSSNQRLDRLHRKCFKLFWKWKSQAGRPRIPENIRKLIAQMAQENPTWGQARVAAELSVKLGIFVSPRTVRAYWPPEPERRGHRRSSSQNWRTFVRNHAQSMVACDFLGVVTARFRTLYVFPLMEVGTRCFVHCNVTAHPTATWTLQQLREAIPSDPFLSFPSP
jgi:putative transposase